MGNAVGRICDNCQDCLAFIKLRKKNRLQYLELSEFQQAKNDVKDIIEESKQNDESIVEKIESSEFLEYFLSPIEENSEKMIDKDGYLVYGQDLNEGFLIKAQWDSAFSSKDILKYFRLADERKKWDKNIEDIEELESTDMNEYFTYTKFKKMLTISQRDMMIVSNISVRDDGIMVVSRSCDHENYPEDTNIIRMKIYLAGYYFKESPIKGFKTRVFTLTKANFGGSISQKFVKKATALAIPKLYQSMEKCMQDYYRRN